LKDQRGLADEQLARVYAPIGLELNAETPQEIAISILAQIIMLRRGGDGLPMHEQKLALMEAVSTGLNG
jgi:xanthine dehydrogenase accessory factor